MPDMPSVLKGEINIKGTFTDNNRVKRKKIVNPKSKMTESFNDKNWLKYPFCNEYLAVFA